MAFGRTLRHHTQVLGVLERDRNPGCSIVGTAAFEIEHIWPPRDGTAALSAGADAPARCYITRPSCLVDALDTLLENWPHHPDDGSLRWRHGARTLPVAMVISQLLYFSYVCLLSLPHRNPCNQLYRNSFLIGVPCKLIYKIAFLLA